ncbi:MAG: hypothetical protein K2R98_03625 [Gemmataceae bacterium]|nr:hypothetical protein [Gemmataceae bacterium]
MSLHENVHERRAFSRVPCQLTLFVGRYSWSTPVSTLTAERIEFHHSASLTPGTDVRLELHNREQGMWLLKTARIFHAALRSDGRWLISATFLRHLSNDELSRLVGS